jgi:ParB/RepB/Spo0J family partition protein
MDTDSIRLNKIEVPEKYRREKSEDLSREQISLSKSIKTLGLRFPITVKEKGSGYVIIDGVRRYNAFRSIRSETIPARVIAASDKRDIDVLRFQLNVHRENLKTIDEAKIIRQIIAEGWSKTEVAEALGKKPSTLDRYFDCLRISGKWQSLVNSGRITLTDAQPIAALSSMGQKYLYSQIRGRELPFNGVTIVSATRAMDPVKHPEWFNLPKQVASQRINERHGHPFAMKKVESVAKMKIITERRQKMIAKFEEEITFAIPIIAKVMKTPEVWDVLPTRSKNAFKDFSNEYIINK